MPSTATSESVPEATRQQAAGLRLVVADMDGTLLDGNGEVPADLWPLLERMRQRGILFVPASGRQYATLAAVFGGSDAGMPYIAENGTYLVRDGREVASTTLDREFVVTAVQLLRDLSRDGHDIGFVLCGKRSAYVERTDEAFLVNVRRYYAALELVTDVLEPEDDVLKLAVFDFGDVETGVAPSLAGFRDTQQVVVSGQHWADVMPAGVNKGTALRSLQQSLGITREQTAAFGDYLNDLEMLDEAGLSFAMANAHPEVLARAGAVAPANTEGGVVHTVTRLLGTDGA
ncbi:HAD family hydrolase [Kineosporia sp. J2-2]|uniref:HAD family hydrolase n=1 Tax=Kineosporia corallincola TaxID=2835133 RepID=A0ABS5TRL8_9ACTN|nr:Cof-type HAD-IIB family hydrolase [Kineosporia corallincola]MBT0773446.1 HAD family hydrolase [Kineosporia corallincola]